MYNLMSFLDRNSLPRPGSSLRTKTGNSENIVHAKKSVTVSLLFTIFALHSKNYLGLDSIQFGLELGIGRDVNILAIINCIINNIYSDDDLSMITREVFLNKLSDIHYMDPRVLDVIKKKVENRRSFLNEMQTIIRSRPQYVFNYKHMRK
ncbi:uncharacterized protein LOC109857772 isoform X1 [Pseudomyrmex gracilis]|uniref:uncharacterized protein LOC109857772 isoform X1 n=1 Tax=Pseudomyrmex gracilis TaxID=219809 RepID=UPI000994C2B7|nr:uncharacterized protein LOC109857772 isoform X1 [Pseudomyrmex gracilis]